MDSTVNNNTNFIFFEDFDDKPVGYGDGKSYFNNLNSTNYVDASNSTSDNILDENVNKLFKMKLRSTVADSKFREQSANTLKFNNVEYDRTEKYKTEDIFDLSFNDGNYYVNTDSDSKIYGENEFTKMESFENKVNLYSTNDSFDTDGYKDESVEFEVDEFMEDSKEEYRVFSEDKKRNKIKYDNSDLVSSLREIANQIEFNNFKDKSKKNKYEEHITYLNNKITNLKNERDICYQNLHMAIKKSDMIKSKLENRIMELESHVTQLSLMVKEGESPTVEEFKTDEIERKYTKGESTTLPSMTIEFDDLDQKTRSAVGKLIKYLYADINDSENSTFLPNIYKCLREMPSVTDSKDLVNYIKESIAKDSQTIKLKILQNNRFQKETFTSESPLGVPQTNQERQAVSELESTLHITGMKNGNNEKMDYYSQDFRMMMKENQPSKSQVNEGLASLKTHVLMNRSVLLTILKASKINHLYNYLFEALNCDNFRVVEIINEAVCSKFMDFQMVPKLVSKVKHPLMWAFGPKADCNQAQRYIQMVKYNFEKMPKDPTTGENIWHMVAKGKGQNLAQKLKPFSMYATHLNEENKDGKTPLQISTKEVKKEMYINLILYFASKGSEMYKSSNFEEAMKYYTDALTLQSRLTEIQVTSPSDIYSYVGDRETKGDHKGNLEGIFEQRTTMKSGSASSDNHDLNMGKLYYNRARTLMHLNRWTETIENCELCLKHIPNYPNAYETSIKAYENLLDWKNAASVSISMKDNCGFHDETKYQYILDQKDATYFQLLGIDKNATTSDIKKAFNSMCKIWHPDKIPQNFPEDIKKRCINHFNRLFEAREKLMDPTTKSLQQVKKETNYKIPSIHVNDEKSKEYREDQKLEASADREYEILREGKKAESDKEAADGSQEKVKKNEVKYIKSRENLNELVEERLKFIDSMNLLKGQAEFDFDSTSWGQL